MTNRQAGRSALVLIIVLLSIACATLAWMLLQRPAEDLHPPIAHDTPALPPAAAPDSPLAGMFARRADPESTARIPLAANGESPYVIALGDVEEPGRLREAAELLQSSIRDATGATLRIVEEARVPDGTAAIYLGRSRAAREAGIPVDTVSGWHYLMRVVGDNIYLVGDESTGRGQHNTGQYSGTMRAAVDFLERFAGVRFVLPGPMGIHVPTLEEITVDADLDTTWSPLFQVITGRRVGRGSTMDPYALANQYPAVMGYVRGPRFFAGGSHTWGYYVPAEEYFETHPEYFRMTREGERSAFRNILCISNPEVHELLLKGMEQKMDEGYDMVMLGQADGYIECQCENCQAIHPDISEKLWIVHRMLAEEMNRRRPGKKVVLLSYVTAIKPPATFDEFPENVIIMNNRYTPDYFAAWKSFDTPRMVYLPKWLGRYRFGSPRYTVELVRLFIENNVVGIYLGGGLDCSSGSAWGLYGPRYYAFGQAMKNPTRSADALEREYVNASFGEAAAPMLEFFTLLHRRAEFLIRIDRMNVSLEDRRFRGFPFDTKPSDMLCHILAPKIMNEMSAAMERANALAQDPKVKARLELVEAEFRWLRSQAAIHHMYRAYRVAPSPALLHALEAQVEEYKEMLAWLAPGGRRREPGGRNQLRAPFDRGDLPELPTWGPFRWDYDALRASRELPRADLNMRIRGGDQLPPWRPDLETRERLVRLTAAGLQDTDDYGFHDETIDAPFDE